MKIRGFLAAALVLAGIGSADAAQLTSPFLTGPSDPSQTNATVNGLVVAINAILSPLTGAGAINGTVPNSGLTAVNLIDLTPGITGSLPQIGLQNSADTNAGIQILPNGTGNIVLGGSGSTGYLQFANAGSFVPATGIGACPSVGKNTGPLGVNPSIQGFVVVTDWLNRSRYLPAC